jgi:putative aminopeptidase FrvX
MMDRKELVAFAKELFSAAGVSGHEQPARDVVRPRWEALVDEIEVSRLGSLHALRHGRGPAPRPRVMLAAHVDVVGLMVKQVVGSFLRVSEIGVVDSRMLPGQPVVVHGRRDLPGVVTHPPIPLLDPDRPAKSAPRIDEMFVDTGLSATEVSRLARVGDAISFAQPPIELGDSRLSGRGLDDRVGILAITICLNQLQQLAHVWEVAAVATVNEEMTFGGAHTSAFSLRPELAVAIDATHASGLPGLPEFKAFPMGGGPTIGMGSDIHPGLVRTFEAAAKAAEIPYALEVMPAHSGTDARAMQATREGVPTMVLGIPVRYMHSPVEVVDLADVERTGRLLAAVIASLDDDFMQRLVWE